MIASARIITNSLLNFNVVRIPFQFKVYELLYGHKATKQNNACGVQLSEG